MENGRGLLGFSNDGAAAYCVTGFYSDMDIPEFGSIQRIYADTTGDVFSGIFCNLRKRTLNTIKNIVQDARSKGNGNGISGSFYGFTGS